MTLLLDTSAAVPLVMRRHEAHAIVVVAVGDSDPSLAAHSALETYSVLTRLPGDARLSPSDAARLIENRFGSPVVPSADTTSGLVRKLADRSVSGGAAYDALIALTAADAGAELLTRDRRAAATYLALDVPHRII